MKSDFFAQYKNEIRPKLQKKLKLNLMQIPSIEKIVVNAGIGSFLKKINSKNPDFVIENLTKICGQKPVLRKAKVSVSNFKVREGMPVGVSTTLRKHAAYNFLGKLIHIVFPRVRDFRGVKKNIFDPNGNCSFGFSDFTVFPETEIPEDSRKIHGLQVTIVFSGEKNPEFSRQFLELFNFPFKK